MKGKSIIIVQGHLDTKWKDWFEGMVISYEGKTPFFPEILRMKLIYMGF